MRQATNPVPPTGLALLLLVCPLLVILGRRAVAGDWHSGATSVCSDCHTMHNSSGRVPMRYDSDPQGAPKLLRHATSLSLCIYCHDGSLPGSPDVIGPVSYVADPAGGSFPPTWSIPSGTAHVLGGDPVKPPGGTLSMTLTCVSCHDPHGGPGFRNLRTDPAGGGVPPVTVTATQRIKANGANASDVYVQGNIIYRSGLAAWCGSCHKDFHGRSADQEGAASPWLRHPQDQTISTSARADYTYWLGNVPNRVRVQSPTDDDVPSADDQVFCLSCHKAHGSPNRAALIFADGARLGSTCQQCHNE
jgi:predicted CXXCH cytochrome family protein